MVEIEHRSGGCGRICGEILAGLGDWFGQADSNAAYIRDAEAGPAWLATVSGEPLGLMMLKRHFPETLEIHFLAVRRERRGQGLGRALVVAAEAKARAGGGVFLLVKTLGPSEPYPPYAETRAFYRALGFAPLEELDLWGPENPTLLMVKAL